MTYRRYIPFSTKNIKFDFSKYKVENLNVNGKPNSMVICPAFTG